MHLVLKLLHADTTSCQHYLVPTLLGASTPLCEQRFLVPTRVCAHILSGNTL